MRPIVQLSALILILLLAFATTAADELCILPVDAICCFPCDVFYALGGTGFSTDGPPCWTGGDFSISASATDALVNEGPLGQFDTLYLWLFASAGPGYGFPGAEIEFSGDLQVIQYEHLSGGSGTFSLTEQTLLLDVPCLNGTQLLGALQTLDPISVESDSWGEVKARWRR